MAREFQLTSEQQQDWIDIEKSGVYRIRNIQNGKSYIGSTVMTMRKRINHHLSMLQTNAHKNKHLQQSWNKWTGDNFVFEIVEVVDDKSKVLEREQFYINTERPEYNINQLATGTSGLSSEVIAQRTLTFTESIREAMSYYYKVKKGELTLEQVPEKHMKTVVSKLNYIPVNKGIIGLKNNNYPTNRKERDNQQELNEIRRSKLPIVYAFRQGILIGSWSNVFVLEDESKLDTFNIRSYMKLRNLNGRGGLPPYLCSVPNVQKSCLKGIPYKGLQFSYQPSLQVTVDENVDENGGGLQ